LCPSIKSAIRGSALMKAYMVVCHGQLPVAQEVMMQQS